MENILYAVHGKSWSNVSLVVTVWYIMTRFNPYNKLICQEDFH